MTAQTLKAGDPAPQGAKEGQEFGNLVVKNGILVAKTGGAPAAPTVAPRPENDSAGGAGARAAAGTISGAVGGALGKVAGAAIQAAGAGTSGTAEAEGSRQIAQQKEELAAQQNAQAQQHQQAANADIISRGDQWAGAKDAAMNQKRVANQSAASGAASALNREVSASDYGEQQAQANIRRQAGEVRTDQSAQNRVSAIGNRTDAAVSERENKQIQEQNAAIDQVTQAEGTPDVPAETTKNEETPVTPSPDTPGDVATQETPEVTQETPEVTPEEEQNGVTPEVKKAAIDRVVNTLEKPDKSPLAGPGDPLYEEGIIAFENPDDAVFKAWAEKVNAEAKAQGVQGWVNGNGDKEQATAGSMAGKFVGGKSQNKPGDGMTAEQSKASEALGVKAGGNKSLGDRRIKDLKKIISDARMKSQKERTRKLVSSIYRRF